jgi:hypothetical protein
MRRILLLLPALAAACTTAPAGTPVQGVTPGQKCEAPSDGSLLGQQATSETGAVIMRASHAAVLRWAPPGSMLTMDYREDRVTVHLDAAGKVTEIKCG